MPDERTLEVDLDKSQSLNSLFEQLSSQQVQVVSMRNKANRLEELFVNLVEEGRKA
ncbi:MAG: ABC transporter ATP-binding protein, partial [Aeromonas sobria]